MAFQEYDRYDATGLAELVKTKQVTPLELIDEAIDRVERVNPKINAVVHKRFDQAREEAKGELPDGPFRGVPFLVKDLLQGVPDLPLTNGSRYFQHFKADHFGELINRYRKAGLVIVGKTSTPEFGLVPYTEPELFGPCRNPWHLDHTPGGSSGGSAASVAAGIVPMAHGGDGGGSIRIPASCTGLFGIKPTRARNPMGPDMGEGWRGLVVEHVLSRSVRDSAAILDATHGMDLGALYDAPAPKGTFLAATQSPPRPLRIGVSNQPMLGTKVHPEAARAVNDAADLLRKLGHEVFEVKPVGVNFADLAQAFIVVIASETAALCFGSEQYVGRKAVPEDFEQATYTLALCGKAYSAMNLAQAAWFIHLTCRTIASWFEQYDVLLTPVLAAPPVRVGELQPKPYERAMMTLLRYLPFKPLLQLALKLMAPKAFDWVSHTPIFNMTGQPAMSVPMYWTAQGLPVGVHAVGRFGDEETLFALAAQIEQAKPWFDKRPPVHAGVL